MTIVFRRGYRGGRRRSGPRAVVQSYKKVILFAEATFTAGFQSEIIVDGKDSLAAGQTSATDANVPTGCIVRFIEVQFAAHNPAESACYLNCTLMYTLSGQGVIDPDTVGGNDRRNQILHMDLFSVGGFQNSTHKFKFKIPPKFQRVREGMQWRLVWNNSATINRKVQMIYKFYR